MSPTVLILTIATTMVFHAAEAASQTQTERRTSIGASLFLEAPSFGYPDTLVDIGGPRGLQPGVSIRIARELTSRVSIGLDVDLAAAHISRGESLGPPSEQSFRFDTFSPVLLYQIGSTRRWEFGVDGGLAFAYIKSGDVTATYPWPAEVAYTLGFTTGLSAQMRTTGPLTLVADLRATSLKMSGVQGLVIRPGVGVRFKF